MTDEKIYRTDFRNDRKGRVQVRDYENDLLFIMEPGADCFLEAWDPRMAWARFSQVTFQENDKVDLKENPEWIDPLAGQRVIELFNEDGNSTEVISIGGVFWKAFRGIPRTIPVPLSDRLIFYQKIHWKRVEITIPMPHFPNYVKREFVVQMLKEERPKREQNRIRDELEQAAVEEAKRQVAKTLDSRKPGASNK